MKKYIFFLLAAGIIVFSYCSRDEESENFRLLTGPTWRSDSLLVDGIDASQPGGLLEDFTGDVKFNEDGTGTFGNYSGTWSFAINETQLIITSESLPVPLTTRIAELTESSLKITTSYPNLQNPSDPMDLRMTFKPK